MSGKKYVTRQCRVHSADPCFGFSQEVLMLMSAWVRGKGLQLQTDCDECKLFATVDTLPPSAPFRLLAYPPLYKYVREMETETNLPVHKYQRERERRGERERERERGGRTHGRV